VSTQNLVKATAAEVRCHQAGHRAGNDKQGWGRCVWLQDGRNRLRYRVDTVRDKWANQVRQSRATMWRGK